MFKVTGMQMYEGRLMMPAVNKIIHDFFDRDSILP